MKRIVVLTGAGMSEESGLKTFRDAGGLWEGHDIMQVASPQGWRADPFMVLDFYNQRRKQLLKAEPNEGHQLLVELERQYDVKIITQNVDDLHERAGSTSVLHLHGELLKVRSTQKTDLVYEWRKDLHMGDLCEFGSQLRPHIVWFGEAVPLLDLAIDITAMADYLIIIGTSMQVYPAASLINYTKPEVPVYFIDPKPAINETHYPKLTVISEKAGAGMRKLLELIP